MTLINSSKLQKLEKFLVDKAGLCIHEPFGQLPHRFVTPSYGVEPGADDDTACLRTSTGQYLQMYDWDACFFSQGARWLFDKKLVLDIINNFLSIKTADGHVPRTVSPGRNWDVGDHCKPFLCQTLLHTIKYFPDMTLSLELVKSLKHYLDYFEFKRKHGSGLFHWRNMLESGVDNNLALIAPEPAAKGENNGHLDFLDGRILPVDLNTYLIKEFEAFSHLADLCGESILASEYEDKSKDLKQLVETMLWCKEKQIYLNWNPQLSKFVETLSWTSLVPTMFGIAPEERATAVIDNYMFNDREFLSPTGLSSASRSEILYNQSFRGLYGRATVSNWQGPMWVLPNVLAVRGLKFYGLEEKAKEIAQRVTDTLADAVAITGTLNENYDAETGRPLWSPQFMSWNILALELLELIS